DLLARQPIHDGHNRGVRARTPLRKRVADIAYRAFLHSPQRRHAIQLQRRQFQDFPFPRSVASIRLCRHIHRVSFARFVIVLDATPGFWLDALAFPKSPPVRPAGAAAGTAVRTGAFSPPLKYAALFSSTRLSAAFRSVQSSCVGTPSSVARIAAILESKSSK